MKRFIAVLLAVSMLFVFASCGDQKKNNNTSTTKNSVEHTTLPPQEPLTGAPILYSTDKQLVFLVDKEYMVYSISGNTITGLCGYQKCESVKKAQEAVKQFRNTVIGSIKNVDGVNSQGEYIIKYYNPSEYANTSIDQLKKEFGDKEVKQ